MLKDAKNSFFFFFFSDYVLLCKEHVEKYIENFGKKIRITIFFFWGGGRCIQWRLF